MQHAVPYTRTHNKPAHNSWGLPLVLIPQAHQKYTMTKSRPPMEKVWQVTDGRHQWKVADGRSLRVTEGH